ncbi:flagellar hook-associated protein FlgL [Gayadomonas joobiniege]|uniref:flagellar hook-associated protein FlgL n=1 Tax=Gayadomonas joobiniege TaxID=1234606 RepID=UPI0003810311|nr:flagellar hook-associated protein FlgL [Gayadomonas joobiniege]
MRITTNMIYNRSLDNILDSQKRLLKASETLNSQTDIHKPSDDPTGASKVIRFDEDLAKIEQYQDNAISLKTGLVGQETALENMYGVLNQANSLALQAGNGGLNDADLKAIAGELEQITASLADLMNSQDSQGNYIFSGTKADTKPFVRNSAGDYVYQGNQATNKIQISETLKIEAGIAGGGAAIFERVASRESASMLATSTASGTVRVADADTFDQFHQTEYRHIPPAAAGSNNYSVVLTAADQYEVRQNDGTVLQTGPFTPGEGVAFNGLTLDIQGSQGDSFDFTLDPRASGNILNSLTDLVKSLRSSSHTDDALTTQIQSTMFSIEKTQESMSAARSQIGGRINVMDSVNLSQEDLKINIQEAKANVSEADLAKAITELQKQETAYQVSNTTFGRVSGLSLFNFI